MVALLQVVLDLLQIGPGLQDGLRGALDLQLRRAVGDLRRFQLLRRGDAFVLQPPSTAQLEFGVLQVDLRLLAPRLLDRQLRPGVVAHGDEALRFQLEEGRAGLDRLALLDEEVLDLADHVGGDVDLHPRVDLAAALDDLRDVARLDLLAVDLGRLAPVAAQHAGGDDGAEPENDRDDDERAFHQPPAMPPSAASPTLSATPTSQSTTTVTVAAGFDTLPTME